MSSTNGTEGRLRIATWNLERPSTASWRKLPARLAQIAAVDADIWILTETRESIRPSPGRWYAVHTPPHPDRRPDPDERWVSIWSRYPLRDAGIEPSPRGAVAAIADTPLGEVAVYGTVLPWHCERGVAGVASNWVEHRAELGRQAAEWRALSKRMSAVCVAGDFNQSLSGYGYGTRELRAAHHAAQDAARLTCPTQGEVVDGLPVIDHILLSRAWAVSHRAQVSATWGRRNADGVRMSDHSGVAVDVSPA